MDQSPDENFESYKDYVVVLLKEIDKCKVNNCNLAGVVLTGSMLEALFINWFAETYHEDKSRLGLSKIIDDASEKLGSGWDKTRDLAKEVNEFRNKIHPGRVYRNHLSPEKLVSDQDFTDILNKAVKVMASLPFPK